MLVSITPSVKDLREKLILHRLLTKHTVRYYHQPTANSSVFRYFHHWHLCKSLKIKSIPQKFKKKQLYIKRESDKY